MIKNFNTINSSLITLYLAWCVIGGLLLNNFKMLILINVALMLAFIFFHIIISIKEKISTDKNIEVVKNIACSELLLIFGFVIISAIKLAF